MTMDSMTTSPLRVAVAGLGAIGREHLEIVANNAHAQLVAVVDPLEPVREEVASSLDVAAYGSVDGLLAAGAVDAVVLATPDQLHFADARRILDAGVHLLVEKPIATDRDEIVELVALAERADVVAMPGQTLRFEPRYHWAHSRYTAGDFGELQHGYLRRDNKTSVAARTRGRTSADFFLGVHDVDALLWVTGLAAVEVSAAESRFREPSGTESVAVLSTITMENGAVVQMESAWNLPETYPTDLDAAFRLVGTEGILSIPSFDSGAHSARAGFELPMTAGAPLYGVPQGPLAVEDDQFVRACLEGAVPPVTMREAGQAALVIHAIRDAVSGRRTVEVPRLP